MNELLGASSFTIRGAKSRGNFFLVLALVLLIPTLLLAPKWMSAEGDARIGSWVGLLGLCFLFIAIKNYTTRLTYTTGGTLALRKLYPQRQLQLSKLIYAEKYRFPLGKYSNRMLKLVDEDGNTLRIYIDEFNYNDFGDMADIIRPYIFVPRVEKNFTTFVYRGAPKGPKRNVGYYFAASLKAFGRTFLFVVLPALLISGALIVWAIITKQPAFR